MFSKRTGSFVSVRANTRLKTESAASVTSSPDHQSLRCHVFVPSSRGRLAAKIYAIHYLLFSTTFQKHFGIPGRLLAFRATQCRLREEHGAKDSLERGRKV
jgi:hypothetical protein